MSGGRGEVPGVQLVGRSPEIAGLEGKLAEAAAGRGATVVLAGPAGIGKTSLAAAATDLARERGMAAHNARGHVGEGELAFGVVRQLFERSVHAAETGDLLTGSARLALPALQPGAATNGAAADPHALQHGLFWLCSNLSERDPLLLVADDVQWADPASVRFLAYLTNRVHDLPILLVLGLRTGEELDSELFDPLLAAAEVVDIDPLGQTETATLVRAACGDTAAGAFCDACHAASGGNPFLLRELLRTVTDASIPPTSASVARVEEITPAAVLRAVGARLSRLPPDAAALARGLAVVGPASTLHRVALVAGLDQGAAAEAADALAAAGIITSGSTLDFVHPLIRAAVYDQLGPGELVTAHTIAADAYTASDGVGEHAAMHLLHVPPAGDVERVRILLSAAAAAIGRGVPEAAARYLLRALDEPPPNNERGSVLFQLGRAEAMLAARESLDHLSEALELTTELEGKVAVLRETAYVMVANFGLVSEAYETMGTALELAGDDAELRMRLYAEQMTWGVMHDAQPIGEHLPGLEEATAGLTGESTGERALLAVLAWTRMSCGLPVAAVREPAAAALADGRLAAALGSSSITVSIGAMALAFTLSREELDPIQALHLHQARVEGSSHGIGVQTYHSGVADLLSGRLLDAEALFREGLDATLQVNSSGVMWLLAGYIDALRERGEVDAAWRELESLGFAGDLPEMSLVALLRLSRGRLRAVRGDLDGGLDDVMAAGAAYRRWGVTSPAHCPWRSAAAEIHLAKGDEAAAATLLEHDLAVARPAGLDHLIGRALRLQARCEDGPEAIARLREAIDVLEPGDARLEHAHALIDLGAAVRNANGDSHARGNAMPLLRQGVDEAQRCGAVPLVRHGLTELRAAGSRQKQPALSGPDSLTAAERRVARLAIEGLRNREIAEALFITLKTVEKHLGNCYAKLEIRSRSELGRALADPSPR